MLPIQRFIMNCGGMAQTYDLNAAGYWQSMIQLYSSYGRIVNVCRG